MTLVLLKINTFGMPIFKPFTEAFSGRKTGSEGSATVVESNGSWPAKTSTSDTFKTVVDIYVSLHTTVVLETIGIEVLAN